MNITKLLGLTDQEVNQDTDYLARPVGPLDTATVELAEGWLGGFTTIFTDSLGNIGDSPFYLYTFK